MGVFRKIDSPMGRVREKAKYNILKVLLLMGTHHYLGSYFYTEWKYYFLMGMTLSGFYVVELFSDRWLVDSSSSVHFT